MSRNLFLVKYEDNYYDDTSEILEQTFLKEEIYEKLEKYLDIREIPETKDSEDMVSIFYIKEDNLIGVIQDILIPECIRESENIDKEIIDGETENKILSFGITANILKLLILKRDNYKNDSNILLIVG